MLDFLAESAKMPSDNLTDRKQRSMPTEGSPSSKPLVEPATRPDLESALVQALAEVRLVPVSEVRSDWQDTGDVEIKSVEADAIVVSVENLLGQGVLAEAADLKESERTSLRSLHDLLQRSLEKGGRNDRRG